MRDAATNRIVTKGLFACLFLVGLMVGGTEAAVTLAWDPPATNEDGTACTDLAAYRIYYDTDAIGDPYTGTGLPEGDSPIDVPLSALADPSHPEFVLSDVLPGTTYFITVTALDSSNNESNFSNHVEVVEQPPADTEAPTVSITTPTASSNYETASGIVSLGGTAADNTAVSTVGWSNNRGGSGVAIGTGSWTVDGVALAEGENIITVTAQDAAGNAGSDMLIVIYTAPDTSAPSVFITSPTESASYETQSSALTLGGTASDSGAISLVTWSNSQGGNGTANGTGHWSTGSISLVEGENVITVTAQDAAGNTGTDRLTVTYTMPDTTAPSILITSPTVSGSYETQTNSLTLAGTAADNTAVSMVTWSNSRGGNGTAGGTDSWSTGSISLLEGQNLITVTAQDAAGNTDSDTLTVTYTAPDTTPPSIVITSPTIHPTHTTTSDSIGLAGTASDDTQLTHISWSTDRGISGTATGTGIWSVAAISLAEGENVITVTAHDGAGNSSDDRLTVTCTPSEPNGKPTANAGADQTVTQGQLASEGIQVALDGSLSSDPDGDPLTYAWRQTQGSAVNLMGSNSVSPFFSVTTALVGQSLAFELTVNDGQMSSDPDTVIVTVDELPPPENEPPAVQADATPVEGSAPLAVSFSGTASDRDGTVTGYLWNFGDGQSATAEDPSHTYDTPGTYTARFTATDDDGATASATLRIVVTAPPENVPPTVSMTADPATGEAPVTVHFTASASDSDGTIASYQWRFGDGTTSQAANPSHTYAEAGRYSATVTVTDNEAAAATTSTTIVVSAPPSNTPPSVSVLADPTRGSAPLEVNFNCSASDSDGRVVSYRWNFGDGGTSQTAEAAHRYAHRGDYTASLTVTDDQGAETTRTIAIQVLENPSNQDSDDDGLTDAQEEAHGLNPHAIDSDDDGLSDFIEWGPAETPADTDNDGTLDGLDVDSDGDGSLDADEGTGDADGDGAANYVDRDDRDGPLGDQDGDGVNNSTEVTHMMNPNVPDSDGDGIPDGTEFGAGTEPEDSDGDGTPDALDLDSDGDGKMDSDEGAGDDDGDGAPNFRDANDNDGPYLDLDHDGLSNARETELGLNPNLADSDGDGVDDMTEVGDPHAPTDTDGDGVVDALDSDSDSDGVWDVIEARQDFDENGLMDRVDPTTATVVGHDGKRIALKVLTEGARLSNTKFVKDPIPDLLWQIIRHFRLGGLSFEVEDLPIGGSATIQILIDRPFARGTRYWKYDPVVGYYQIPCAVSRNALTVELVDGNVGDVNPVPDGTIVDPGFIEEPLVSTGEPQPSGNSSGGIGCSLSPRSGSIQDGLTFLIPLLLIWMARRRRAI